VLRGLAQLVAGGRVTLKFRGGDHSAVVFEAYRASDDRWVVRYRHPLSAYQAFSVAIAVLHNPTTQLLDYCLPPLDDPLFVPEPLPSTFLVPMDTLSHAYSVVYCVCVYGHRVFCGTHSGHLQQWQCPVGSQPTVVVWRAHSATVYAVAVAGRSLISASRDWLLRVWDLSSLTLVATLPGHRGPVRCLASCIAHPNTVYSGSHDGTVRVWDVSTLQGGDSKRGNVLKGHGSWVRAVVCSTFGNRLCSASKNVRVWDTETKTLLQTFDVRNWIYCLAICRVTIGCAQRDTLYAGCGSGKIRAWKLWDNKQDQSGEFPERAERKVRALACHGHVLLCGDTGGGLMAWDLSTKPVQGRTLDAQTHTAGVRSIAVDVLTNTVFTASDDRCIKVWGEARLDPPT